MALTAFDPTEEIALTLDYPLLRPPGLGVFSESSGASPGFDRQVPCPGGIVYQCRPPPHLWIRGSSCF
jgi:hypothetical protein